MVMSFGHRRAALSLRQSGNPLLWLLGLQYFTFFFLICSMFVELNLLWLDFPKVKK